MLVFLAKVPASLGHAVINSSTTLVILDRD